MTKQPTVKATITLDIPDDFEMDEDEIGFIEVLAADAARRGSTIEDTVACEMHQYGHKQAVVGAKFMQNAVRELAGAAFAEGRDADATAIRKLVTQLDQCITTLDAMRAKHEELFITSYHRRQEKIRRGEKVED